MPDCNAPADAGEFVYCSVQAMSSVIDTIALLGSILVAVAIALAGYRLVVKLINMSAQ